jgi:hypothetical protein
MALDDRHMMTDGRPWKRLDSVTMLDDRTTTTTTTTSAVAPTPTVVHPDPLAIRRAIERRSVATLATVSAIGRPHAATVLYQCADDALFVSTYRGSRKARNVADSGLAAMTIAVRRLPFGPPASIQFQTSAEVLANDDAEIKRLAAAGRLKRITAHGEMNLPGACFLRLALPARVVTYALGMSLWRALRNPLDAAGEVHLHAARRTEEEDRDGGS